MAITLNNTCLLYRTLVLFMQMDPMFSIMCTIYLHTFVPVLSGMSLVDQDWVFGSPMQCEVLRSLSQTID